MKSSDLNPASEDANRGFHFPGEFEISAMGSASADLPALMRAALAEAGLRCVEGVERVRPSRQGNYVSVTLAFHAAHRDDYEAAHSALRALPEVKWTL